MNELGCVSIPVETGNSTADLRSKSLRQSQVLSKSTPKERHLVDEIWKILTKVTRVAYPGEEERVSTGDLKVFLMAVLSI